MKTGHSGRLAQPIHSITAHKDTQRSSFRAASLAAVLAMTSFPALADIDLGKGLSIYGIIDAGVAELNTGTTPRTLLAGSPSTPDTATVKAGNTSRLGFKGYRDLKNGAYGRFQIEHRFATDTGAASNTNVFWLARSVVAIGKDNLGEIYAGREYSPAYWVALNADPTLWSYVSQTAAPYTYANYTAVASSVEASNIRWSNAVGYKTPNLGGFTGEYQAAAGEGSRGRNNAGNVQYTKKNGLWLGAGFDRLDARNNLTLAAGGYDFGVVFPKLSWARAKGGLNGDARSYTASALIRVSYGRITAAVGKLKPTLSAKSTMYGVGTQYDLDKDTLLYVNLGSAKQDGKTRTTAYDFGIKYTF